MSTYTPIASATIGTATNSVTFAGIPQTYSDLMVVVYGQASGSNLTGVAFTCNGDTAANYSYTRLYGNDLNVVSTDTASGATRAVFGFVSGFFDTTVLEIADYTNTNTYKSARSRSGINDYGRYVFAYTNRYASTNAITSLTILTDNSAINFTTGTTIGIYGIANASISNTAKATGGDIITTDGTYWYHGFLTSGTFTPTQSINADVLIVAGGGGSGRTGGGGGAGGLRSLTGQALSATNYTVTIGGGGTGSTLDGGVATNGSTSTFHTTNASGGGGGASFNNSGNGNGAAGGSGGGGGTSDGSTSFTRLGGAGNAGSYSPAEGNSGGNGNNARGSGGGGGAGAAGSSAPSSNTGGAGGNGSSSFSAWGLATGTGQNISGTVWFAGGGGGSGLSTGGAAGNGGAGAGGVLNSSAKNATANTGGGAGSNNDMNGYAGGSGIVIVRYAV